MTGDKLVQLPVGPGFTTRATDLGSVALSCLIAKPPKVCSHWGQGQRLLLNAGLVQREESEGFLRLGGFAERRLQSEGGVSHSTSGSVALFWWNSATHMGLALLVTPVQRGRVWLCHPVGRRGSWKLFGDVFIDFL